MKKITGKVVGVMYENDKKYGGRNRQDILKEIYETRGQKLVLGAHNIKRKDGGEAVLLYDIKSNQIIGWLERGKTTDLTTRNHANYYLGEISYHGCYHVSVISISEREANERLAETA